MNLNVELINITNLEIGNFLSKDSTLYFDIETRGLYGKLQVAQFYQPDYYHKVFLVENPDPVQLAEYLLKFKHIVGHNIGYDFAAILTNLSKEVDNTIYQANPFKNLDKKIKISDTFYATRLLYPKNKEFGLKKIISNFFNTNPYDEVGVDKKLAANVVNWDLSDENHKKYCALDVFVLPTIYSNVREIEDDNHEMNTQYKLDISTTFIGMEIQTNGYPILMDKVITRHHNVSAELKRIPLDFNANSVKQVREKLGLEPDENGVYPSTDKNNLSRLMIDSFSSDKAKVAKNILLTRSKRLELNFLDKFLKSNKDTTGQYIYRGHLSPSARSGRFTSSENNIQNIPREFYDLFGIDNDNEVLITSDFSQLELRTFAAVIGDTKMSRAFKDKVDIHTLTTREMFDIEDPNPDQRFIGKSCNFLLLYGGSADILLTTVLKSGKLIITKEQAEKFREKFLRVWAKVKEYKNQGYADHQRGRTWKTILGREYKGIIATDFLNIKIQGSGADIAKLALYYMHNNDMPTEANMRIRNFVHDSYVVTCNKEYYKQVSEFIASCMEKAWKTCCEKGLCVIRDIPMPIDVLVGKAVGGELSGNIAKYKLEEGVGTWKQNLD